jgi:tetrahydromethanopterin S-methyltransferase subunit G
MDQSKGLSSALLINWANHAEGEGKAIGGGRSSAILLGALVGLIIFIFLSSLTPAFKKS